MQESGVDLKMKLQNYIKKQQKWGQEKQTLLKTITLLQQEVTKYKTINNNLLKKYKHKRTSSEQQTFIFNQTNISSYYPVVILKNNNWTHKTNLRSHLDSVRSINFFQGKLISAGEDSTLKIWQKQQLKLTVREHLGPIYTMSCTLNEMFTGGAQGVVRKWSYYGLQKNECAQFEADIHDQPIWDIITNSKNRLLITSSGDQSHKLLKYTQNDYKQMWTNKIVNDAPTSIEWINEEKFISGFKNQSKITVFDVQTKCQLYSYHFQPKQKYFQTNKLQIHSKNKILAAANDDHYIRFYDPNSNRLIKELAAHSDSVTSLLFNYQGFELISCGHDGNLRFWDLRKYKCVSDVAVSMKKYDENILCLAQNKEEGYICVGGADGLIKILNKQH